MRRLRAGVYLPLLSILLFHVSCVSLLNRMVQSKHPELYEKGTTEASVRKDTCGIAPPSAVTFDEFQKQSYHEKRSVAAFRVHREALCSLAESLGNVLDTAMERRGNVYVWFSVFPDGRVRFAGCRDSVEVPKEAAKTLDTALSAVRFDSLPGHNALARFTLRLSNQDSSAACSLLDSVVYWERGRSKASIMGVVMERIHELKDLYDRTLARKPKMEGKVTVTFVINAHGEVIFAKIKHSNCDDIVFEEAIVNVIRSWRFAVLHKPGDVTEVHYPFVFNIRNTQLAK